MEGVDLHGKYMEGVDLRMMKTIKSEYADSRGILGERKHWLLDDLGVSTRYQGMGIGSALLDWGLKQADEEAVLEVFLFKLG
jgi:ribosomal protein S18 acetylase RimI-like enzyme